MKITVKDIAGQEEANKILTMKNMSHRFKMSRISALTGLCSRCKEKPAAKLVLFKLDGAYKMERYCLEHFGYCAYEDRKKKKRKRVK